MGEYWMMGEYGVSNSLDISSCFQSGSFCSDRRAACLEGNRKLFLNMRNSELAVDTATGVFVDVEEQKSTLDPSQLLSNRANLKMVLNDVSIVFQCSI